MGLEGNKGYSRQSYEDIEKGIEDLARSVDTNTSPDEIREKFVEQSTFVGEKEVLHNKAWDQATAENTVRDQAEVLREQQAVEQNETAELLKKMHEAAGIKPETVVGFEGNFSKGKESTNHGPEVYSNPEMERIVERASDLFIESINKKQGTYNIALCGGRSSVEFYKKISERASEIEELSKLQIFLIDERFGTNEGVYDISDRNTAVIEEYLVKQLVEEHNFSPENFHTLPEGENVSEVTEAYNAVFKENVPDGKFDLVVLGSGEDGHVAGIFPGKEAIDSKDEGFSYEMNSPKYPPIRITALPKTIQESHMTFLFIVGKAKEQALENFKNNTGIAATVLNKAEKVIAFTDIEKGT